MSYVCLWSPAWQTDAAFSDNLVELLPALLVHAPRIVFGDGQVWGDARGLHANILAEQLLGVLHTHGSAPARAGTALTPIAAEAAATWSAGRKEMIAHRVQDGDAVVRTNPFITSVTPGRDRAFIAGFPVSLLSPSTHLATLLDGIGVENCGEFAALDAGSVEIRLGTEGVHLWKRACANDNRWLFQTPIRTLPSASLDWTDYVLRNADRLVFVVNSLLSSICASLTSQGERAREISIVFSLSNKTRHTQVLRSARPTADQKRWLRLIRSAIENLTLPDAATGIAIQVESVVGNDGTQGDLFDRGFASAHLVEMSLAQLADDHDKLLVAPRTSLHPLADERTTWVAEDPSRIAFNNVAGNNTPAPSPAPTLTLQLCEHPRPIRVTTTPRRDHDVPVRYCDDTGWHNLVDIAGPDRVSGHQWDGAYAREYFRCVREDGMLVWLFREGVAEGNAWYLHGWWD